MSLNSATSGLMVKVFPIKILGRKKLLFESVENSPGYILKKMFFQHCCDRFRTFQILADAVGRFNCCLLLWQIKAVYHVCYRALWKHTQASPLRVPDLGFFQNNSVLSCSLEVEEGDRNWTQVPNICSIRNAWHNIFKAYMLGRKTNISESVAIMFRSSDFKSAVNHEAHTVRVALVS